jgi:hypothetical protein
MGRMFLNLERGNNDGLTIVISFFVSDTTTSRASLCVIYRVTIKRICEISGGEEKIRFGWVKREREKEERENIK